MGIKIRGKTSTGAPVPGAIEERELEINLADKSLYTSSDGTDIVELSSPEKGGLPWKAGFYLSGVVVTYAGYIFSANKDTSEIPTSAALDWDAVTNTTNNIPGADAVLKVVRITRSSYDTLPVPRDPDVLFIIQG